MWLIPDLIRPPGGPVLSPDKSPVNFVNFPGTSILGSVFWICSGGVFVSVYTESKCSVMTPRV